MRRQEEPVEVASGSRLDERVLLTLQNLPGEIAFNGLRRMLDAHPESLARALRRLEREGLVLRARGGYRSLAPAPRPDGAGDGLRTVAEVGLASGIDAPALVARLSTRWFGTLRWVGTFERSGELLLAWAPRAGAGVVLLGARAGRLRVAVPEGLSEADPAEVEEAAFELLLHAVEALRDGASALAHPSPVRPLARAAVAVPLEN